MSFYNMVLLWALAGRNDILIWLTGWSFRTFTCQALLISRKHEPLPPLDRTCGGTSSHCALCVRSMKYQADNRAYTWLERENLAEDFKVLYWATGVFVS